MSDELATPIEEIIARLNYRTGTGLALEGWKVFAIPIADVKGYTDFPCVALFIPSFEETNHAGGRTGFVSAEMSVPLIVSVRRSLGLPALLRGVAKVLNAIELTKTNPGAVDRNLGGTVKPFKAKTENNFVLDVSLNAQLTLTIEPKPYLRGGR